MSDFNLTPLLNYAEKENIFVPESAKEHFKIYGEMLLFWNEKINLTAITEPKEVVIKHFCDCLSILKHIDLKKGTKLIDIGSGAGFPGMVLKILRPESDIYLLDGHAKRFIFLKELQKEIGLYTENLHIRAELASKTPELREAFDYATARAVSNLPVLCEYTLPFVKVSGEFISMKGPEPEEEINLAKRAVSVLGGGEPELYKELLPDGTLHSIIKIKKISQTPTKYPRASAKITKQPL